MELRLMAVFEDLTRGNPKLKEIAFGSTDELTGIREGTARSR